VSRVTILQAALGGPVVAAIAWLGLVRMPWLRRPVGAVLALGALASSCVVFWLVYRGEELVWRSFQPGLLAATVVVVVELTLLLAAMRAESLPDGGNAPTIVGLGVCACAVAALSYAGSIGVVALALPLPTVAVACAALSGRGREDARGLIGLAAADALALIGLSLTYARTGSVAVDAAGGAGPALLLLAALLKAGAIPGVATWRLSAGKGPASWLDAAMRGQAVALAALAALTMRNSAPAAAMAIAIAVTIPLGGAIAMMAGTKERILAAAAGAAAGLPFLALGLGGAVGTRAFLLLFPAVLLAASLVAFLTRDSGEEAAGNRGAATGAWGWLAAAAAGVALGSLLGMPPGGGFPGTWLALSLAVARSEVTLAWLPAAAGAAVGLTVAFTASITLIRAARPRAVTAAIGAIVALGLLYVGAQPVRVGIGWWIRVETALGLPEVLPTAGAPGFPIIGGVRMALLLAPALVLVAAVVALGRGVRGMRWDPAAASRGEAILARRLGRLLEPFAAVLRPLTRQVDRARSLGAGYGLAAVLEVGAVLLAGRIVLLSARAGFL